MLPIMQSDSEDSDKDMVNDLDGKINEAKQGSSINQRHPPASLSNMPPSLSDAPPSPSETQTENVLELTYR